MHHGRVIDEPGSGPTRTGYHENKQEGCTDDPSASTANAGFYGRMVKPGTPESDRFPLEIVEVLLDLTIIDARLENPTSICPDSSPHGDWKAMDYDPLMSGPRGTAAATLILV